jgi:hypothetical protein
MARETKGITMKTWLLAIMIPLGLWATPVLAGGGFDQTLILQGISFHVQCANRGSVNMLRIHPSGGITRHLPLQQEIFGTVTGAEIADLNADGYPIDKE